MVLGWLNLRDEDWSDGFGADEIQRLVDVTSEASVVLSNIQEFQALEEEHRLAALGAMAAGLAHEIRNPLAGIKGAAQFLQTEQLHEPRVVVPEAVAQTYEERAHSAASGRTSAGMANSASRCSAKYSSVS